MNSSVTSDQGSEELSGGHAANVILHEFALAFQARGAMARSISRGSGRDRKWNTMYAVRPWLPTAPEKASMTLRMLWLLLSAYESKGGLVDCLPRTDGDDFNDHGQRMVPYRQLSRAASQGEVSQEPPQGARPPSPSGVSP